MRIRDGQDYWNIRQTSCCCGDYVKRSGFACAGQLFLPPRAVLMAGNQTHMRLYIILWVKSCFKYRDVRAICCPSEPSLWHAARQHLSQNYCLLLDFHTAQSLYMQNSSFPNYLGPIYKLIFVNNFFLPCNHV